MKPRSIPKLSLSDLRHRAEAVGRAGGVRDDVVALGVVAIVVHAEGERDVGVGRGRRDHDLLRAGVEVLLGALAVGEEAGRLDARRRRRGSPTASSAGSRSTSSLISLPGRVQHAVLDGDLALERPERRVELEQVRHRLRVAEIVGGDDLEVGVARQRRAEEVAPDAAEAVDANTSLVIGAAL